VTVVIVVTVYPDPTPRIETRSVIGSPSAVTVVMVVTIVLLCLVREEGVSPSARADTARRVISAAGSSAKS
jgi:hypothetical protein